MRIKKGDYLVVGYDNKNQLVKALTDLEGKTIEVVNEKHCHISSLRTTATIGVKDVVLNLGEKPHPGKVYGLDVTTLYYTRKVHSDIGTVNFFYKPEVEVVRDLWGAFTKVHALLKKRGLSFLLDNICWEVLPANGEKYSGMFLKSKSDKLPARIQIRPEITPATEYAYVILHELGHNMHLSYVTSKKLQGHWLRMFNTSIKPITVTKSDSSRLLEALIAQEDVPSAFKSQLEEQDSLAYKWIIRTIGQVSQLSIKDLDVLFEADMRDEIKSVWPLHTIQHKDLSPIVSEYATKNVKELVAESFAFHLTGKKLPEALVRLLEKTMSHAKSNQEGS